MRGCPRYSLLPTLQLSKCIYLSLICPNFTQLHIIPNFSDRADSGMGAQWTRLNQHTGDQEILRADRFHRPDRNAIKDDCMACMGIRVHMWNRANVRRLITHPLIGGESHQQGYDALDLYFIKQGEAGGRLGRYMVLSCLPEKVAGSQLSS